MSRPYLVRRATKRDLPLITNSWLKSFRDADWVKGCPNSVYYGFQHRIIEHLIPRSVVLCAVNEDDIDQILGWCAAEVVEAGEGARVLVVHYVYVKHPFRKLGIAKTLVESLIAAEHPVATMYTHKTLVCPKMRLRDRGLVYNPYIMLSTLPEGWAGVSNEAA